MDDSTRLAVLDDVAAELRDLLTWLGAAGGLDMAAAEQRVRAVVVAIGARVLEAGLAMRGAGKVGARIGCGCGGTATFEGYRPKEVQTLVGWVTVRRAYYTCPACGHGRCPLDAALGLGRDSHSPLVRRLAVEFGARLPFAPAAALLGQAAGITLAATTMRAVTEDEGGRREVETREAVARAWRDGLPAAGDASPDRLYVAMDGVRILSTDGAGQEAKVGVVMPVRQTATSEVRAAASYAASFEAADAFGRRLALEAHRRGLEDTGAVVVLGDGAEWIWNLAAEHFPTATCIVDWFHASERIWTLGRTLFGAETAATVAWVDQQLAALADGQVATLVAAWRALPCRGEAIAIRDEQVTYFTNQADRMAYDRYRAEGWDIGSGMVESACKYVIGAREKGPGMRWSRQGANAVAQVRVALFNHRWTDQPVVT